MNKMVTSTFESDEALESVADQTVIAEGDSDRDPILQFMADDAKRTDFWFSYRDACIFAKEIHDVSITQRVWSRWYGSRKAADRVEAILRASKGVEQAKFLKKYKHVEPLILLSIVFGNRNARVLLYDGLSPEVVDTICPFKRAIEAATDIVSKYGYDYNAENLKVVEDIEAAWPFIGRLFEANCFRYDIAGLLRIVAMLREIAASDKVSKTDLPVIRVATVLCLHHIPHRLEALAAITDPFVASCYQTKFKFAGITRENFDPTKNIWDQVASVHFHDTCQSIMARDPFKHELLGALGFWQEQISSLIIAQNRSMRWIDRFYSEFCQDAEAGAFYSGILDTIKQHQSSIDGLPEVDSSVFVPDLVGRPVSFEYPGEINEKFDELGKLMHYNTIAVEQVESALAKDRKRLAEIESIQQQLQEVLATNNLADLKKVSPLAEQVSKLIDTGREWYLDEYLPAATQYAQNWHTFYSTIEELSLKVAKATGTVEVAPRKPEKNADPVAAEVVSSPEVSPPDAKHDELNDLLHLAQAENDHLRTELADARGELHRLRCQLSSKTDTQEDGLQVACMDAIERLVTRKEYGPADVLSFYAGTAPDRVVVLPRALAGAKEYQLPYDPTERMLEMVGKLVGPYLDALRSGQADTKARETFGGKAYAAKESQTTMSTSRLRAQREFEYKGEVHVFEQHLRISNEPGARGMRIYFGVDGEGDDKKVVIAYVGPHLDVTRTN